MENRPWKTCPGGQWHCFPEHANTLLWLSRDTLTHMFLCCKHTITITITTHHLFAHTPSFGAGWVRLLSLASLRTWGELLFASGKWDNLDAACSGLSKTTVSFPCTQTHTLAAHKPLLFPHLHFQLLLQSLVGSYQPLSVPFLSLPLLVVSFAPPQLLS